MKLYATTTSERASKGQGGNKELDIRIYCGSREDSREVITILGRVLPPETSRDNKASAVFQIWGANGELCQRQIIKLPTKGKRQKGESDFEKNLAHVQDVAKKLNQNIY